MKLQTIKQQARLQEWASQINAQRKSGMTVTKWCELNEISYKSFYYRLRRVQEELLEALETRGSKSNISDLAIISANRLPVKHEPPVITPVNIPQSKGAALTVWIGHYAIDVQNGADAGTIDYVLKAVSRL